MTRILVTRPAGEADRLRERLEADGFDVVHVPTVAIDSASAADNVDRMLESLDGADWLVLTSANGARALAERMSRIGRRPPPAVRVAAVGPATAAALSAAGIGVSHVPDRYLTVAIADGLGDVAGRRVVLARADAASPGLRAELLARGARVEEVVAYRTVEAPDTSREPLRLALRSGVEGIAFTSSSTVRGLLALTDGESRSRALAAPALCIGPVTAADARRHGFRVAGVASDHTSEGLARLIHAHFARED